MSTAATRVFEDAPAVRTATPLLIGLDGPSGGGKTYSALRLATGIQRVVGGDVFGIDTESNRMLHYADKFKFRHVPFRAPFGPLDYLAAIDHCVSKGAKTIIVDSMSHEHEGPGGVLEMHEQEVTRLSGGDQAKAERIKMLAWGKPKAARRRLINSILQINANFIFCFRAKEKVKLIRGKEPEQLGYMPIAGEEFVFEMTVCCLLLPGAKGIPTWESEFPGERMMMKQPGQFADLFEQAVALDEDTGMKMAQWAAGAPPAPTAEDYETCSTLQQLEQLEKRRALNWNALQANSKAKLKSASDAAKQRISNNTTPSTTTAEPEQPLMTPEAAIAALRACTDDLARLNTWAEISERFCGDVPLEIDAVNNEMKEKFEL